MSIDTKPVTLMDTHLLHVDHGITISSGVTASDCNLKWEMVKPCFTHDIGTQRCRLPSDFFTHVRDVAIGSYVCIDLGSHSCVCSAYLWKDQPAKYCQVDNSVTIPTSIGTLSTKSIVSLASITRLRVETMKRITVRLVVDSYSDIVRFKKDEDSLIPFLRDILSMYCVTIKARIDGENSIPCRLLRVCLIFVEDCDLASSSSVGRVNPKTVVEITNVSSRARYEASECQKSEVALGGLEKPKRLLHDLLTLPSRHKELVGYLGVNCPKGVLLIGPPGTGKTSLVHAVVQECGASLVYLAGPTVCKSNPGESESSLRKIFSRAQKLSEEGPCVLFIDEIDSILAKPMHDKGGTQSARLSSQALTLLDELGQTENLVVIGATNRPNVLVPAVRRPGRFDREVYVGVPTQLDRECILKALTSKLPLQNVNIANIAECTPGFVGADLFSLCQQVSLNKLCIANQISINETDFHHVIMTMRPSTQRSGFTVTDFQHTSWTDIGGLEDVKLQIRQSIEWPMKHLEAFQRLGIPKPKGILLYGPPGCCKTTLVRAAATACNASFLSASAAQIYSSFVGDSERAVTELFRQARLGAPAILFLDEIDSIVGKRTFGSSRGTHEKVLATLLNEMDGIGLMLDCKQGSHHDQLCEETCMNNKVDFGEVLLVAATNRLDLLDEALLRPGRFDRIIYVPPPDHMTRIEILKVLTAKMPVSDVNFEDLAKRSCNFTGADLENLCKEAALCALTSDGLDAHFVFHDHFLAVLKSMKPSLSEKQIDLYAVQQAKYGHYT